MLYRATPAFFCAIALCLGTALFHAFSLTLCIIAVVYLSFTPKHMILFLAIGFICAYLRADNPHQIKTPIHLTGQFVPSRSAHAQLPFGNGTIIYGHFDNYPVSLLLLNRKKLPIDGTYKVSGTLKPGKGKSLLFKPDKGTKWIKEPKSFSIVGVRYRLKHKLKKHIQENIKEKGAAEFLSAILCGELENRHMRFYFNKVGLSHILAISGLHFGIIAMLIGWLLKKTFPFRWVTPLLLIVINAYAWMLGDSPSVLRACAMIDIALLGRLTGRYGHPINFVGAAALFEMILFPEHILHRGFLMTYTATLSILLFYPTMHRLTGKLFLPRTRHEIAQFSNLGLCEFIMCGFFRKMIAVTLAVNATMSIMITALFGSFPLLSLLYNLLIPPMLIVCLTCLIIGLSIGPLGAPLHAFNTLWTTFMLDLIRYPPQFLNIKIRASWLTPDLALILISALLLYALSYAAKNRGKLSDTHSSAFPRSVSII